MNYNYLLKNCNLDKNKLLQYGFAAQDDALHFRKDLLNGLYVTVDVSADLQKLNVDVMDGIFNEKYAPFVSGHGGAAIKSEVREILDGILSACSTNAVDARKEIVDYMYQTYGTVGEFPWEDDNVDCTFKTARSKKWYALVMEISEKSMGFLGDEKINVINLKLPPQTICELVDNVQYFPAYHMNKKYWMTVLLNKDTNLEKLKQLVDVSHSLTEK